MRDQNTWKELLTIEPEFNPLEGRVHAGEINSYDQIPAKAFSWHAWDLIPEERLFKMILPFLRSQLGRAVVSMPEIYAPGCQGIDNAALESREDWWSLPVLVKDDDPEIGLRGFRSKVANDPKVMKPTDIGAPMVAFGSGGSIGKYTPTYVTPADRAREIQAWRRGHDYHGLIPGDTALYTYNTTHKGGQWMQESLWAHGVNVLLRRPEEGPRQVLENMRAYAANMLFTVQQPYEVIENQSKAVGMNLHSLVMESLENPDLRGILVPDENGRRQIDFIFLGGFEIVPYACELADEYLDGIPIATLLGSSEAIPQACSTNPSLTPHAACHYNRMHLMHAPHYIEILKPAGEQWVPVEKGEQGLLVYTSWARDGTLWVRYAPGDLATKTLDEGECPCGIVSPVIKDVHRKNVQEMQELFILGCAAG